MVVLEELQPRYIVLYDCDMGFVRQVGLDAPYNREVQVCLIRLRCIKPRDLGCTPGSIFCYTGAALNFTKEFSTLLRFRGSVEEQAYLTTLRREKKAFESLIKEKATMVVPEDREARTFAASNCDSEETKYSTSKLFWQAGEEREAGKASDSAVASSNTRRGGGVQQVKVGCVASQFFCSTKAKGDSSSDCRHERVQERSPEPPPQERN